MVTVGELVPWGQDPLVAYQKGHIPEFYNITIWDEPYKGKWVVLFFYPRDFTFICPTELQGFSDALPEFKKLNTEIIACSTDSEWSHKTWFERDLPNISYPIIADTAQDVSRGFEVLRKDGSAARGLFIIDPESIVRYALVSSDSVGRSAKETLRVLEALQSGELCPMEWKQGEKTLGKA